MGAENLRTPHTEESQACSAETVVELVRAERRDMELISSMLQLYFHDLSEFTPWLGTMSNNGRIEYPDLDAYWLDPVLHPLLIRSGDSNAGFAFVQQGSHLDGDSSVSDIAEFFILRSFRRKGIGMRAAHRAFRDFGSNWEIRVRECNLPAIAFWRQTVDTFSRGRFSTEPHSEDGSLWRVFRFRSEG